MKIAGATVFRGLEGYGETGEIHKSHLVRHNQPILISIVDTAENINRLIPVIEQMIGTGMLAESDVQMIRVQKTSAAQGDT
jgi:PII-like signaling protein